jgi:hypothetical protein
MSTEEFWLISAKHNIVKQASDIDTESGTVAPNNQTVSMKTSSIELVKRNGADGGEFLVNDTNQTAIDSARVDAPSLRGNASSQVRPFEETFDPLSTGLEGNDDLAAQVTEKLDLLLAKFRSNGARSLATSGTDEDPRSPEVAVLIDGN